MGARNIRIKSEVFLEDVLYVFSGLPFLYKLGPNCLIASVSLSAISMSVSFVLLLFFGLLLHLTSL
jgi:hypothetical protein